MTFLQETWRVLHKHPRERFKLVLGWLLFRRATRLWLDHLQAHGALWAQVPKLPKLITRIYRPYALRGLTCVERVQHMIGHHHCLQRYGLIDLFERSMAQALDVLKLPTKNDCAISLHLVSLHDGHREGEMHLQLHFNGRGLYSLSFLLRPGAQGLELLVTRLQGSNAAGAREDVRFVTKALYGLRPAVLLIQATRQLAQSAGCTAVLLVSHRHRVALNPKRRWKLQSNLETLWQEVGAQIQADGFFMLSPIVPIPVDFSDVSSNKRAEARRRADVLQQTLRAVDQLILSYRAPVHSS